MDRSIEHAVMLTVLTELLDSSSSSSDSSESSSSSSDTDDDIIMMLMDEPSSNEEEEENAVDKEKATGGEKGNFLSTLSHFSDMDFQSHFKLPRTGVELVLQLIVRTDVKPQGRPQLDPSKALLITLWALSNQESFRAIGERFGHNKGRVYEIICRMCKTLKDNCDEVIQFPKTPQALAQAAEGFEQINTEHQFPGVVGCIDVTHIQIPGPLRDKTYYNRYGRHSIHLQAVCDSHLKFTDVFVGYPGSASDTTVYHESPIGKSLLENDLNMGDYHLLGDECFTLHRHLITPYKDDGSLTMKHIQFNKILNSTRVLIEHAFARLKGTFERLTYCPSQKIINCTNVVIACCVLHNIAIDCGVDHYITSIEDEENDADDLQEDDSPEAVEKRDQLMAQLVDC